jgi:8-oxo-dGTP diphosphatase
MQKTFIDKLAYIYVRDKKILVTRSQGKDTWYIPGGKREEGETDQEALIREVYEELSVPLLKNTIDFYGVFEAPAHGKPLGTMVRMTCYTATFEGELIPSAEIAELDFFTHPQKEKTSAVDHLIFDDLHQRGWIE